MTDHVYWMLRFNINEGQNDAFEAVMAEMIAATREESGALDYEWHRDGDQVHVFERYASNDAAGIHLKNFGANFAERFMSIISITGFDVYGPAEGAVLEGLTGIGAKFFGKIGGLDR